MAVIAITAVTLLTGTAFAGSWQVDSYGWWYLNDDGSYPVLSWIYDGGEWYHFNEYGYMDTGWVWDGAWYYMYPNGIMATGWVHDGGNWYYMYPDGIMATGWVHDGGNWYYMYPDGIMATGWVQDGGNWYYMYPDGIMATGWVQDGENWYYFDEYGRMYTNAYIDQKYFLDENGQWDGITMNGIPETEKPVIGSQESAGELKFTFIQNGWYVARLFLKLWDYVYEGPVTVYSDSCAIGQTTSFTVDTDRYEVQMVGYDIWFLGWDSYTYGFWDMLDKATTFTLSGWGDYPKFTW